MGDERMLKLYPLETIALEDSLRTAFKGSSVVHTKVVSKGTEGSKHLCYIYLKSNEWNEEAEEKIFQIMKRRFSIELVFWTNHSALDRAIKRLKDNVALLVEHPKRKGRTTFTTYMLN
jgi:hypothetical protein